MNMAITTWCRTASDAEVWNAGVNRGTHQATHCSFVSGAVGVGAATLHCHMVAIRVPGILKGIKFNRQTVGNAGIAHAAHSYTFSVSGGGGVLHNKGQTVSRRTTNSRRVDLKCEIGCEPFIDWLRDGEPGCCRCGMEGAHT